MEADLPMELRGWYLMAASQFGWSKAEFIEKIATNAHEVIFLTIDKEYGAGPVEIPDRICSSIFYWSAIA